jgi:ribosomal-protein-alanine N-acetyltransferase
MINVTIKEITQIDLDEVMEIEMLSYPNHYWSRTSFESEISNKLATYKCALSPKGNIAGFYGFWQILEEAHITTFATHPEFRRQGVANALMIDVIAECYKKMIKYITLEVRESNIAAISLYDKFGFSTIGTRKKYYQDNNEDALIMFTENIWYDKFKNNYNEIKAEYYGK